jgi:CheY-like chemotaxis protein
MDINLPGISGVDAMRILANDPATEKIPVIALSANAMPHDIARGLSAGFFRYLTKPIKVNEFMDTLDVALNIGSAAATREPAAAARELIRPIDAIGAIGATTITP